MSCVACCSHAMTREGHQPAPRERLVQNQSWDQKGSCLVALTLLSTIAHSPGIVGTGCAHKRRRAAKEGMPLSTNNARPLALLPTAEVLRAPRLLGIWTPGSHSCKANPMPAGSFSLSGNCWQEAGALQASFTKPRVTQPGVCSSLPCCPGMGCWKLWGSAAISGS